jgi:hypothetical protein
MVALTIQIYEHDGRKQLAAASLSVIPLTFRRNSKCDCLWNSCRWLLVCRLLGYLFRERGLPRHHFLPARAQAPSNEESDLT